MIELAGNPFEATEENAIWAMLVLRDEGFDRKSGRRAATAQDALTIARQYVKEMNALV